jgi:hypothetical protein
MAKGALGTTEGPTMVQTYIERLKLSQSFAGKGDNDLDRLKGLAAEGWDLTVLVEHEPTATGRPKATGSVIALGCRPDDE